MVRVPITKVGTVEDGWIPKDFEFDGIHQDHLYHNTLTGHRIDCGMQSFSTEVMLEHWA